MKISKLRRSFSFRAFKFSEAAMGHGHSLPEVEGFSREEVSRLEKRFQKLDLDHSGTISVGEFLSVPELKENPLVKRVVDIFDEDLSGEVDFKGAVSMLDAVVVSIRIFETNKYRILQTLKIGPLFISHLFKFKITFY